MLRQPSHSSVSEAILVKRSSRQVGHVFVLWRAFLEAFGGKWTEVVAEITVRKHIVGRPFSIKGNVLISANGIPYT